MKTVRAALLYFGVVFGVGFILGTARVLWVVPRLGPRAAELMEAPIMVAASFWAARWIVRRMEVPAARTARLGMGVGALLLMLAAEFGLVLRVRGIGIAEYLATRDPVSGTAYYLALLVFALAPILISRAPSDTPRAPRR